MGKTIKSGIAMLEVLESWGVDHIYGIPGGSINSIMRALYEKQDTIRYIQVRHEEAGALAASADAKLTGKIGVCFGSAGPGATHLFNGLYDAQMDSVPMLAIIGQVSSKAMNTDAFQEMNENPMFADVSIYNRTVMNPESLPSVVDEAIRRAHEHKGVAVVTVPVDYGYVDIADVAVSTARLHRTGVILPDVKDIDSALELIEKAERPVLFVGQGARSAQKELLAMSEHFSIPIVVTVLAKGIIPDSEPNFLGTSGRLGTKPANEALAATDLIIFIGSNFPFARQVFNPDAKFIQIDIDSSRLGKRHHTDVAILGDAGAAIKQLSNKGKPRVTAWLEANRLNRRNWLAWMRSLAGREDKLLRPEAVFEQINRIATPDAVFAADVGNATIFAVRMLDMNGAGQRFTTSGMFATMGYGVPAGIASRLNYPQRQVFTLNGDGGFSMVMQDVITQVRYGLPVINVVFSNDSLGFIDAEQEDTQQPRYGVDLTGADYAAIGRAMGAKGLTVTRRNQLPEVFDEAAASKIPVIIDVKMENRRPFPSEIMVLDEIRFGHEAVAAFKARYEVEGMPLLRELLDKN